MFNRQKTTFFGLTSHYEINICCKPCYPATILRKSKLHIVTTSSCLCLFAEHRLGSSRLWTHLAVGGSERSAVSVSCHPVRPPLWWNQLLRGSGRWQPTIELPRAFKWWEFAERQSQQVTRQVNLTMGTYTTLQQVIRLGNQIICMCNISWKHHFPVGLVSNQIYSSASFEKGGVYCISP